jgi:hypothetical protein
MTWLLNEFEAYRYAMEFRRCWEKRLRWPEVEHIYAMHIMALEATQ